MLINFVEDRLLDRIDRRSGNCEPEAIPGIFLHLFAPSPKRRRIVRLQGGAAFLDPA